jgi:hypothetical protein
MEKFMNLKSILGAVTSSTAAASGITGCRGTKKNNIVGKE